jgi:acetyl/propionyl-CoA carboxylase alpha subunit
MLKKFTKILIANRGEIALRIIRAARKLDVKTVALYTAGEENAPHALQADEAVFLGDGDLAATWLNINKIIDLAIETRAEAIHPGYGFLSENPELAERCKASGLVFIGPPAEVLRKMGNKLTAKKLALEAGVKVLRNVQFDRSTKPNGAESLNYPLLIKAAHGGGGKGMQLVRTAAELKEKAIKAERAAVSYFGNGEIYLEEFVEEARHIEVQVMADQFGNLVHLGERDCTVQRNHQKIIEEAPAAVISEDLRKQLHHAALELCRKVNYENAGTVEFLVRNDQFWFLEMNPRIQVEHPVSEEVSGIDLVSEQLMVAAGNPLSFAQNEVALKGHAIEVRLYAEDPLNNFAPSGKPVLHYHFPEKAGVRVESAIASASLSSSFDPLLAKIIVSGSNRVAARLRLLEVLADTVIVGPRNNLAYLRSIVASDEFAQNRLHTKYCEQHQSELLELTRSNEKIVQAEAWLAAGLYLLFGPVNAEFNTAWHTAGHFSFHPMIELHLNDEHFKLAYRFTSQGIVVQNGNVETIAIIEKHEKVKNQLFININGEQKAFSFFKENGVSLRLAYDGKVIRVTSPSLLGFYPEDQQAADDGLHHEMQVIKSQLYGKVVAINIEKNQTINKGEVLLVIESMKSENAVLSPKKAKIKEIAVAVGAQVTDQMPLVYLEDL